MPNNKEKINLTPKDFSFICPLSIDELTPIEGGYHCDSCEKKVYDVSHMTKSEFKTLQEKTKDLCISFKKVTTVAVVLSTSGWVAASDDNLTKKTFRDHNRTFHTEKVLMGFMAPQIEKENTFKLEKVKITPKDTNKTNTINALTPPVKCDIETSIDGGDNIAPPYEEENSN